MAAQQLDLHMEAGEDWQRVLILATPLVQNTKVYMEVKNSIGAVIDFLNTDNGKISVQIDGSLLLHLDSQQSLQYGIGFPGVLQSVSYWGTGRAYLYDIFAALTIANPLPWTKILRGFISVEPSVTRTLPTS